MCVCVHVHGHEHVHVHVRVRVRVRVRVHVHVRVHRRGKRSARRCPRAADGSPSAERRSSAKGTPSALPSPLLA